MASKVSPSQPDSEKKVILIYYHFKCEIHCCMAVLLTFIYLRVIALLFLFDQFVCNNCSKFTLCTGQINQQNVLDKAS